MTRLRTFVLAWQRGNHKVTTKPHETFSSFLPTSVFDFSSSGLSIKLRSPSRIDALSSYECRAGSQSMLRVGLIMFL